MLGIATLVAAAAMLLQSPDFPAGGAIPSALMAADCGGRNRTPALAWSNVPPSVKSFALVERDPDAPVTGGFYHWVVYDIPASTRSLGGGSPAHGRTGLASTGKAAYYGPCPPPGPAHHYVFTLYALDFAHAGGGGPLTGQQLEARLRGHVLAHAILEGTAAH
ncbi:MAG: YbhB/YbcL family Raf kinase inhibitor-like protein [Candidatus Tumulicola sp.]